MTTVWIPGRAAEEFEGTEIGQRVQFGGADAVASFEGVDRRVAQTWLDRGRRRAGRGVRISLVADAEVLDYFRDVFGGLELACDQGEIPSGARACRIAIERIDEALSS